MVFTSLPAAYLDAANWQQQQQNHHQQEGNGGSTSQQLLSPPPPPPPLPHAGNSTGSIRPGSMADRARMANLPMPETALKCPRCESTNTKFCYFNNYSLSQPRHFCKTCRRYWTRGGALRNVPVGGGCRRNKRSKGSSSTKSPASSDRQGGSATSTNSISSHNSTASATDIAGFAPQMQSLRFMAPLHHQFSEFGAGDIMGLNYGLSYGPIGDLGSALGGGGLEQWRMPQMQQQFPYLEGSHAASNLYPFEGSASHNEVITGGYVRPKVVSTSGVITQLASVKMEDNNRELNLSNHFLGISSNSHPGSEQYWTSAATGTSAAAWTDISAFSSSSNTNNHM